MTENSARHFVFLVFPDYGHIKPTLQAAKELLARGHRVTYVLDEAYADLVAGLGAEMIGYRSGRRRFADGSFEDLGDVGVEFLKRAIADVLPRVRDALDEDRPDALVYDYENFIVARTLAHEWKCGHVQFAPYLASNEEYSLRAEMFAFNFDNELVKQTVDILMAFLAEQGLGEELVWSIAKEFDDTSNLVFVPRALQPRGESFDDRFDFVGPCVDLSEGRQWDPPEAPAVLISLGTESNDQPDLLKTCATAFLGEPWHVVFTLGRGADTEALSGLGPGIEAHEWYPHVSLLPHVKAFVTHGGMSSVTEALYFGVPMVLVPHTVENRINARRLEELGLGVVLETPVTAAAVREAVQRVSGDPQIRAALDRMKEAIDEAGGVPAAVATLESAVAG